MVEAVVVDPHRVTRHRNGTSHDPLAETAGSGAGRDPTSSRDVVEDGSGRGRRRTARRRAPRNPRRPASASRGARGCRKLRVEGGKAVVLRSALRKGYAPPRRRAHQRVPWRGHGSSSATCVWHVHADPRARARRRSSGRPSTATSNGTQTWLTEDGPGGVALEWRLHSRRSLPGAAGGPVALRPLGAGLSARCRPGADAAAPAARHRATANPGLIVGRGSSGFAA